MTPSAHAATERALRTSPESNTHMVDGLLRPLLHTSWRFYLLVAILGGIVLTGITAWFAQAYQGFGVTGIRWPVFWGFYVTNFVFWIGISHAGTLISAILRLVNAGWRRPVTRCAEVITVFALMIGALFPIIHLGRPWLFFWLIPYPSERLLWPNFRSPLVWDFMAIAIIPVAVSVHTIVSFDFSMAPVPMWHSAIFGPYFVAGAIFSGIASLIIAMAALRRFLRLEA